jgi:hypothetical protein
MGLAQNDPPVERGGSLGVEHTKKVSEEAVLGIFLESSQNFSGIYGKFAVN